VDIQGHVENSVIFSRVGVKAKTKIIDSVIMNDNQIGGRAAISRAMLFPYRKEIMKGSSNIEDTAVIGIPSSSARNRDFPDQIRDGLTVVGISGEIPRGAVIEQGCYVGGGVAAHDIKRLKTLKRGGSIYRGD
jgi:ADP-glucose pyrophosphorylase